MSALLWSFCPFFLLVALGAAATRARWVPVSGLGALMAFVLYLSLPAMLFRLGASGALMQPNLGGLLLAYGAAGAVVLALALAWAQQRRLGRLDVGMAGLVTVFPNTGFLGLPLLTGLLGPQAAGPLAATVLVDVLVFSSVCLALAHSQGHGDDDGAGAAVRKSLKGALRNPLLWSMAVGLLWGEAGWHVPLPVDDTLRMLSAAATPVALFTLGGIVARPQRADSAPLAHRPLNGASLAWPALLKLVLHPALVWAVAWALGGQGTAWTALILAAALPSASNVSMMAEREGVRTPAVARIILLTTALALISLTLWAHALGVQPVGH